MSIQEENDITITQLVLSGVTHVRDSQTIAQDAGRTTPLVNRTVMAKITATGLWIPLTVVAGAITDGTDFPRGIYSGEDIPAATLVAGNVTNVNIVVSGPCTVDEDLLVLENSLTLDTEIDRTDETIRDSLTKISIVPEKTEYVSEHENS